MAASSLPDPRRQQIRLVAQVDSALQRVLMSAARDAEMILRRVETRVGGQVSQAQLLLVLGQLRLLSNRLWGEQVPDEIARIMAQAAVAVSAGSSMLDRYMIAHTDNPKLLDAMARADRQRARRVVQVLETREANYKFELSPRVYKWRALTDDVVEERIAKGMALGKTQRQIAKDVRNLINPTVRGGPSYAAKRLGRTEVANAYHMQSIEDYRSNPFVTGVRWNLSGSHPEPDECDDLANVETSGNPQGVYDKSEVPLKPHPQCFCFLTPETQPFGDFKASLLNGEFNDYLMNKYPDLDPSILP